MIRFRAPAPAARPRAAGFTLLEMLFALSILAIGLLFAASVFPAGYRRMDHGMARERAAWKAMEMLEAAKAVAYENLEDLRNDGASQHTPYDVDGDSLNNEAEPYEYWWYSITRDVPHKRLTTVRVTVTWMEPSGVDDLDNLTLQPSPDGHPDPQVFTSVLYIHDPH